MGQGSLALRRLMEFLDENRDAFGNDISDRTNVLDLAAHYPYSPERWRIFVDGSRVFPEYGSVSQYTHDTDRHLLQPAAGETVVFESAERPRYVVQYELAATFAFALNQSLASGDLLRVGLYDGSDGWYAEQDGTHADDEADFVLERAGSVIYREADQPLPRALTNFSRLRLQSAWYDITRQEWEQSFPRVSQRSGESDRNIQKNEPVATGSAPDQRGPQTGNLPIHFEIQASGSTTGLELEAGSAAQVNLGRTTEQTRIKPPDPFEDTIDATDTWVPLRAFRVDPDRKIVNTQVKDLKVLRYSSDATVSVAISAFPNSKVTFSGGDSWGTPPPLTPTSSVLETRSDVSNIVDQSGTSTTTADNPGAAMLSLATLTPTGQQFQKGASSDTGNQKSNLPRDDIAVAMGKATSTGDVLYPTDWEEDW